MIFWEICTRHTSSDRPTPKTELELLREENQRLREFALETIGNLGSAAEELAAVIRRAKAHLKDIPSAAGD